MFHLSPESLWSLLRPDVVIEGWEASWPSTAGDPGSIGIQPGRSHPLDNGTGCCAAYAPGPKAPPRRIQRCPLPLWRASHPCHCSGVNLARRAS